ncbi:Cinnamoyl-CoA reductase 2 [Apostasia shenzhenica]|uniref:Cinnamoyl-CoA reductase 2 n=1 Tax=Apostasia shenzhenica TaxID=1088818 RepID=A0A2I0B4X6_9ASPA|nr:Cinnamoyl-CoA reductase 2 [Apostasia shenzhenica]
MFRSLPSVAWELSSVISGREWVREGEREQGLVREEMETKMGEQRRVCVTGAGGFVASWLVKLLLSKGYFVHGTVRDPSDEKNGHLKKIVHASERLNLFKADMLDYDAVAAAIAGCEGVFHVASPVPSGKAPNPEDEVIKPAVDGTLNVLKACSQAKISRVVYVSSVVAVSMNPSWTSRHILDENCWSDKEYCRATENWYCLSKTMGESEAFEYAKKHGLDLLSVCPSMVLGPLLQSKVNSSSLFLINILNGNRESIENKIYNFVDVRDIADALLLVYEKPEAAGRYICSAHPCKISELIETLRSLYPGYKYPKNIIDVEWGGPDFSLEKLKKLGWKYRNLKESLVDSIESYEEAGLLVRG